MEQNVIHYLHFEKRSVGVSTALVFFEFYWAWQELMSGKKEIAFMSIGGYNFSCDMDLSRVLLHFSNEVRLEHVSSNQDIM